MNYVICENFNTLLENNIGLIHKKARELSGLYYYRNADYDELITMVTTALWRAWLDQKKQATERNLTEAPYAIGTYLNNHLLTIRREYDEISSKFFEHPKKFSNTIYVDNNDFENKELVDYLISNLNEEEQNIVQWRFIDELTLKQTGQKINKCYERIRNVQNQALEKMRTICNKILK